MQSFIGSTEPSERIVADGGRPQEDDNVRIRLKEVADELRAIDSVLVEPLSLERTIEHVEETAEAYERFKNDDNLRSDGGRPGDVRAEAEAVAGSETLEAEYQAAKKQVDIHAESEPAEGGDGQPTTGAQYFGGVR